MASKLDFLFVYKGKTHFQPIANPQDGSRKRVAHDENDPAIGNRTANSPRAWQVQYNIIPTMLNAMSNDAGPPDAKAFPEATKRPVPVKDATKVSREHQLKTTAVMLKTKPPVCYINGSMWRSS